MLNSSGSTVLPVNETIGVLVWGYGYDPSDLTQFFNTEYPSEFPRPKVIPFPVDGAPAPGPAAWTDPSNGSRELTLDIEWAASAAPGATIYAIYGPPGTEPPYSPTNLAMEDALQAAESLGNLSVLSLSWGEAQGSDVSLESSLQQDFSNLTAAGTTIVAASGDDGGAPNSASNKPCTGGPGVDFPAASPNVLAVGGTQISGGAETAWDLSGGGSSRASNDPAPSWQLRGSAAMTAITGVGRAVPDVSASAANDSFFFGNDLYVGWGTSFAAPFWAGLIADIDSRDASSSSKGLGEIDPAIYDIAALQEIAPSSAPAIANVVGGANCFYHATAGWNPVTGWGTPNATTLARALANESEFQPLTLTLTPDRDVSSGTSIAANVSLPSGSPLIGGQLVLEVLSSATDRWASRLTATLSPSALSWTGSLVLPSNVSGRWANVSVLVTQGTAIGLVADAIGGPPLTATSPSLLQDLESSQVILAVLLVALLALLLLNGRRRTAPGGPSPSTLSGAPSTTPGPPQPPPPVGAPPYTPFCWRCGAQLKGTEPGCPSCGAHFQG